MAGLPQRERHDSDARKGQQARYFVAYQDDGPAGPCGQDMRVTSPWNKLYVFDTPKEMLDFIHDVQVETFRRNARVVGYWAENDGHYPEVRRLAATQTRQPAE